MNNPFLCESIVDGAKCGQPAAYVYKSVHATRIVCDGCVRELQSVKGAVAPAPVMEFALMELVPARQVLLDAKRQVEDAFDSFRRVRVEDTKILEERLARSEVRAGVAEKAGLLIAYWLWVAVGYGVLVTIVGGYLWLR